MYPALTLEPNFLARFQREAQVIAMLERPNIVPVYDFAEYEGRPFLMMKFLEGEALKTHTSESLISNAEILEIDKSVGVALNYAQ